MNSSSDDKIPINPSNVRKSTEKKFTFNIEKENKISEMEILNLKEKYNGDNVPPDFSIADDHYKSRYCGPEIQNAQYLVSNFQINTQELEIRICHCCGRFVQRASLPLSCSLQDFDFLGIGYPLFLNTIKFLTLLFASLFLVTGIFSVASNYRGKYCKTVTQFLEEFKAPNTKENRYLIGDFLKEVRGVCPINWFTRLCLVNKIDDIGAIKIQSVLDFLCLVFIILILQLMRISHGKIIKRFNDENADIQAEDFSVMISNIPVKAEVDYQSELKEFFESKGFPVHEIILLHNTKFLQKLKKQKTKLLQEKLKISKDNKEFYEIEILNELQSQISSINNQISVFSLSLNSGDSRLNSQFVGKAIVSFQRIESKDQVLRNFSLPANIKEKILWEPLSFINVSSGMLTFHNSPLIIEQAPQPQDIIWGNHNFKEKGKSIRRLMTSSICLMAIVFNIWIISMIIDYQNLLLVKKKVKGWKMNVLSEILGFYVAITNMFFYKVFKRAIKSIFIE